MVDRHRLRWLLAIALTSGCSPAHSTLRATAPAGPARGPGAASQPAVERVGDPVFAVTALHGNAGFVVVSARWKRRDAALEAARIEQAWLEREGSSPCSGSLLAHEAAHTDTQTEFELAFPREDAERMLSSAAVLSLRPASHEGSGAGCIRAAVTHEDAEYLAYEPSVWGLVLAARYRPPPLGVAEYGHLVGASAGIARWFGSSHIALAAEVGYGSCRGGSVERQQGCEPDNTLVPVGVSLISRFFGWDVGWWTLGVGAGYQGLAVFGRESRSADPVLHGPRLELSFSRTPAPLRNVPRVVSTQSGLNLGAELLFGPDGVGVQPFVGWSSALTF